MKRSQAAPFATRSVRLLPVAGTVLFLLMAGCRTWHWQWPVKNRGKEPVRLRKFEETVVFQNPDNATHEITVTVVCQNGTAQLHALAADGGDGKEVGKTPLAFKLGYAPVRTSAGYVAYWRIWDDSKSGLWSVSETGEILLNGVLVKEGFAPQRITRRVCSLNSSPAQNITASFQLLEPTAPDAIFTLKLDSLPSGASVYVLNDDMTLGGEYARTPLDISIGMAQESFESEPGRYLHKDWHLWNPEGMIRLQSYDDGTTSVILTCALYKEGFATEKIVHEIFELSPGSEYPGSLTLTIPLLTPEEAVQRDLRQLQEMQFSAPRETPLQTRHPTIIWQAPPAEPDGTKSRQ